MSRTTATESDIPEKGVPETCGLENKALGDGVPKNTEEINRIGFMRPAIFLGILVLGLAADLVTKSRAFSALGMPGGDIAWVIDGVFGFQTTLNEGGLFGMGHGYVHLLSAVSVVALLGIFAWCYFGALRDSVLSVVLGMVSAGILGNLYDRLGLHGLRWTEQDGGNGLVLEGGPVYAVRDWILVMIGSFHWPNFNIADALLVCGAILLGVYAFTMPGPEGGNEGEEEAE